MKPLVGILCDARPHDGTQVRQVNIEYIRAAREGADAEVLLVPLAGDPGILARLDGLLLPGSPSNVAPWRYGGASPRPGTLLDEARDAAALALIPAAIERGLPLLCICRGFQELNVALGGTLHQHVHEIAGRLDHREDCAAATDAQYAPAHAIAIAPDSRLGAIAGVASAQVNSLHHQGIDRLAPGLAADAAAPDGQIEAVSRPGGKGFVLGVQWHPEWRWREDPLSRAIFGAYGAALRGREFARS